jgi:hypothetical protein
VRQPYAYKRKNAKGQMRYRRASFIGRDELPYITIAKPPCTAGLWAIG